jgi:hypothetical protein
MIGGAAAEAVAGGGRMSLGRPGSEAESETGRVEAFSDGVLAVIITIMALFATVSVIWFVPDRRFSR